MNNAKGVVETIGLGRANIRTGGLTTKVFVVALEQRDMEGMQYRAV